MTTATTDDTQARLEYLRAELRAERISYGELSELQSLAPFIDSGDVELLEAAGVPEFQDDDDIPEDYPVRPLQPNDAAKDRATCGTCERSWDDAICTSMTPTPAGRCPFESFHDDDDDGDDTDTGRCAECDGELDTTFGNICEDCADSDSGRGEAACNFRNGDNKPCQREAGHSGVHDCTDPDYKPERGVDYAYGYSATPSTPGDSGEATGRTSERPWEVGTGALTARNHAVYLLLTLLRPAFATWRNRIEKPPQLLCG